MDQALQRIAIAQACGWRIPTVTVGPNAGQLSTDFILGPHGQIELLKVIEDSACATLIANCLLPDYLADLNAMQVVFGTLSEQQKRTCVDHVVCLLNPGQFLFDATAAQWAEAFLKTIGKWQV